MKMKHRNDRLEKRRVVVTGLGVVSPNGVGADAYKNSLRQGVSGIDTISSFDPSRLSCRVAGEVKNVGIDELLPPRELKRTGRSVHLAIAATREALQRAGLCPEGMSLAERQSWGVILGSGGGTADFVEEQYRLYYNDQLRKISAYNVSSSTIGSLSSELSIHFGFHGPSHVISTGCTSSTDALGYAFNLIRFGLADHFVAGGADATITPAIMQGFCVMQAVSTSHNDEPAQAMSLAIQDASIAKDEVGYIALHGTSTVLNDKTETRATKLCFGKHAHELPMSSVKSMIGHPQGASGSAGVVAAICGMNSGFLPPTINLDESDPECDLNYIPNQSIPRSIDIALCNCIGFGSKNSALVIERGALA